MLNISTRAIKLFALLFLFSTALSAQFYTEDFDGGLPADWMAVQNDASAVNATSNWYHTTTGPTGGTAAQTGVLTSTTAANGWMIYDSDANCSGSQDVWLISPSVDCSAYSTVVLGFEMRYARWQSDIFIEVSTDNMATWTEIEIYDDVEITQWAGSPDGSINPVNHVEILSDIAGGQSNVHFAFRFLADQSTSMGQDFIGCGYSWQIDDVYLSDVDPTPAYDMRVNNYYAIAPTYATPASQVSDMGFTCDVENVGTLEATNVNLNLSIRDEANVVLHSQDLDYGTYPPGFINYNYIFPERYTPPATVGQYVGKYEVSMTPDDLAPDNNIIEFDFLVTDSIFAKDTGEDLVLAGTPASEASTSWTLATSYYVPNGNGYKCSSVSFFIGNYAITTPQDVAGGTINVTLYEWEDINGDGEPQASERGDPANTIAGAIVGNASYTIQTDDQVVTLVLENWDDGDLPVRLKDDTQYILAIATSSPTANKVLLVGTDGDEVDYFPTVIMHDSIGIGRYDTFWNTNDISFSADFEPVGGVAPFLRMHVNEDPTSAIEDELAKENIMEIFPNPANEVINFNLELVENFSQANVKITDVSGKIVMDRLYENIQNETFTYDVSQYAQGVYFLHFTSEEGSRAIRFVVGK